MTNGTNSTTALDTKYEFFPSVRRGYRPASDRTFESGAGSHEGRTEFGVSLTVEGKPKDGGEWEAAETQPGVDLRLYGPGDVTGIDDRQVVRVEPEPGTTTFPPNYFPLVEFARPDLPWLFSPERAESKGGKVRPWLCLAVVESDSDDVSFESAGTRPLPAVTAPVSQLPPAEECWAWAHTQVVGELSSGQLEQAFTTESSQSVARLLCPRNLDPNTRYRACIVPTFAPGKRVGLGKDPFETSGGKDSPPTVDLAWPTRKQAGDGETVTLPVYHQWEFTTGDRGDFESLARKLSPRELDDYGVGSRTVNLSDPGPVSLEEGSGLTRDVGGALQSPGLSPAPYPETSGSQDRAKRKALRKLLNDPGSETPDSDVPVVGPPLYGQWYLPAEAGWTLSDQQVPQPPGVPTGGTFLDSWFHELNVDPLHRMPAGFGTEVIQENQEDLMAVAWKQFGDLELANERVGRAQLGDVVGGNATDRFENLGDEVVGFGSRVRDIEELNREILAAGQLRDEGVLDGDPLSYGPATDPAAGGAVDAGGTDFGTGSGTGGAAGDPSSPSTSSATGGLAGDGLGAQVSDLKTGGAEGQAGNLPSAGDGAGFTDGGVATTDEVTSSARLVGVSSPTFRSVTRRGGKLDRGSDRDGGGQLVSDRLQSKPKKDPRTRLGTRFSRVSDALPRVESTTESSSSGGAGTAGPAGGGRTAPEPTTGADVDLPDWRLGPGGEPLSLLEALRNLDDERAVIPKALLQVESARDHCTTARDMLGRLDDRLREGAEAESGSTEGGSTGGSGGASSGSTGTSDASGGGSGGDGGGGSGGDGGGGSGGDGGGGSGGDDGEAEEQRSLLSLVAEEPTVADYCEAIEGNTFDTLGRQLSKLVAVDPDSVDPAFTDRRKHELIEELRSAHTRLVETVEAVSEQVRAAETGEEQGTGDGQAEGDAGDDGSGEATPATPTPESSPAAWRGEVAEATRAIDDIESTLDEIEQYIQGAAVPTEPMSAETDAPEPTEPMATPAMTEPMQVRSAPVDGEVAAMRKQMLSGTAELPGTLDASGWTKQRAAWKIHPGIMSREVELGRIMAAPEFDRPAYEPLKELDESYLLPGVSDIPKNTVGVLETNQEFIESYLCGLNHEFARELLWRRYPTDRRGTYFRQFWNYTEGNERADVRKLHQWDRSELGGNAPGDTGGTPENLAVLVIRGELLRAYPNTRVYAVKAVKEDTDESGGTNWDRVPLLERRRQQALEKRRDPSKDVETFLEYDRQQLEGWEPKEPIFQGKLDPDITFLGFDLGSAAAEGETINEGGEKTELGWFFVLEEPVGETRFGMDVASPGDFASAKQGLEPYGMPFGISYGPDSNDGRSVKRMGADAYNGGAEAGWNGLSWGHLVEKESELDAKTYVRVGKDRPAGGSDPAWAVEGGQQWTMDPHEEKWEADDAATWGLNSAHMARATWQLPVRVCIHADDMMPDVSGIKMVQAKPVLVSDTQPADTDGGDGGDAAGGDGGDGS